MFSDKSTDIIAVKLLSEKSLTGRLLALLWAILSINEVVISTYINEFGFLRTILHPPKVQVFKPRKDNRYSKIKVVSHTGKSVSAETIISASDLLSLVNEETDIIAIDEAQFLDTALPAICRWFAEKRGKHIVVAGLNTDFRGEVFGPMGELAAVADEIILKSAKCTICGRAALRSQRLVDGEPANYYDPIELIGEKEMYEPRCKTHHEVVGTPDPQAKKLIRAVNPKPNTKYFLRPDTASQSREVWFLDYANCAEMIWVKFPNGSPASCPRHWLYEEQLDRAN